MTVTRADATRSFFVFVQDKNTNNITRIAVPTDTQIGTVANPAELMLTGRLSLSTKTYPVSAAGAVIVVDGNVTVVNVSSPAASLGTVVSVVLPSNPRDGQLVVVKDASGSASVNNITVSAPSGALIDGASSQNITVVWGSMVVYWSSGQWLQLAAGVGTSGGGGGGAPVSASYVVLHTDATLTKERVLTTSGSNISMIDHGAGNTLTLDLTTTTVSASSYTNTNLTVDAYGRITSASNGSSSGWSTTNNTGVWIDGGGKMKTTGSISIDASSRYAPAIGTDVFFFVSGSQNIAAGTNRQVAVVGGDLVVSGGISGSITRLASGASYLVAGSNVTITSQSNGQVVVSTTSGTPTAGVGIGVSGTTVSLDLGATGSITVTTGSGNSVIVSGSGQLISNLAGAGGTIVQVAGSLYTVSSSVVTVTGTGGTSVSSGSNGGTTFTVSSSIGAFVSSSFIVMNVDAQNPNERRLAAGTGVLLTDGGAGSTATLSINNNVVATVSGTTFTGPVSASAGLSGSLQQIGPNLSYLVAGSNVTIVSQSNGQVFISSTGGGGGSSGSNQPWVDGNNKIKTSGSVSIDSNNHYATDYGTDVFLFVSGSKGVATGTNRHVSVFGGDLYVSGNLSASAGLSGSLQQIAPNLPYLIAGSNISISTASNGQVQISTSAAISGSVLPITFDTATIAGYQWTDQNTFVSVGSFEFNPSGIDSMSPAGSTSYTAFLESLIECSTSSMTIQIRLYNVTSNAIVVNSTSTVSNTSALTRVKTVDLSTALSGGTNLYDVQLIVSSGVGQAMVKGSKLRVTWS